MWNAAAMGATAEFHYVHSCDMDLNVHVKICTMEGTLPKLNYEDLLEDPLLQYSGRKQSKFPDLVVEAVVKSESTQEPLHLPVSTAYKHFVRRWEWNEWLKLPLKYSDLPRDALLDLSVYDCGGEGANKTRTCVGTTAVNLFGKRGIFREGQLDLRLDNDDVEGKQPKDFNRLAKLTKKYRSGKIPPVDWLDRLTFAEVERINQKQKQSSNLLFLMIEFAQVHSDGIGHSIVYFEKNGDQSNEFHLKSDILRVMDYEIQHENLVETKHHRLVRAQRTGQSDKDLKPNATLRNRLNEILAYPTTQALSSEEKDLIWQYRFYLSGNKKALAKFVKCTNWNVASEAMQALELVQKWAPMDAEDALELLGPSFKHPGVRHYAVSRMRQSPDADLRLYLLQLVQALKYEKLSDIVSKANNKTLLPSPGMSMSSGSQDNTLNDSSTHSSLPPVTMTVEESPDEEDVGAEREEASQSPDISESDGGLAQFLIDRACRNSVIANYFYWYLVIECEEQEDGLMQQEERVQEMYHTVLRRFKVALKTGPPEWRERGAFLDRQHLFVDKLVQLVKAVARESGNRKRKIERLQALLADTTEAEGLSKFNFVKFQALQLPLDPDVKICGVIPSKATLFKSSLMPARLTFITDRGEDYVTIFKNGDDLRQDQLILQIITLMDRILQQENLDLKLTPYRVLATSSKHGFVQFVDSAAIADILASEGSIQSFFRKYSPSETGPYGIQPDVMDTYVKSCAGYCVITYLLGVGDRHLDNLLLTKSGKLFHIDFGYILGRDPKPLPPPMKLSKEMIEAFGGMTSEHYQEFRKECYTAFLSLRRYANLILNLFSLMVDASVPDIALEPDKTVRKVQDKFRLDLSDEEAVHYMQSLIDVSATAVMAAIVERIHKFAQFWRN